jgi:cysteine-rich repeat protein
MKMFTKKVLVLMFVLVLGVSLASAATVTRSFSPSGGVNINGELEVSLTVDVEEGVDSSLVVEEDLPNGWTIADRGSLTPVGSDRLSRVYVEGLNDPADGTLTYRLTAPSTAGTTNFVGRFFDNDNVAESITGFSSVSVTSSDDLTTYTCRSILSSGTAESNQEVSDPGNFPSGAQGFNSLVQAITTNLYTADNPDSPVATGFGDYCDTSGNLVEEYCVNDLGEYTNLNDAIGGLIRTQPIDCGTGFNCQDGACVSDGTGGVDCGNGNIDVNEVCDGQILTCTIQGNIGRQPCADDCSGYDECVTGFCGDGVLDPEFGEQCDDGNFDENDGCTNTCEIQGAGTVCTSQNLVVCSISQCPDFGGIWNGVCVGAGSVENGQACNLISEVCESGVCDSVTGLCVSSSAPAANVRDVIQLINDNTDLACILETIDAVKNNEPAPGCN